MAISKDNPINAQEVINRFMSRVHDPAYNAAVYWLGHEPTYINSGGLAGRAIAKPSTNSITSSGNDLTAATMIGSLKAYANRTTVYRRARHGLRTDSGTSYHYIHVCRLHDGYKVNYGYGSYSIADGSLPVATNVRNFIDNLRAVADIAQTGIGIVDLRVCHSSCHSSCHGSRGRR